MCIRDSYKSITDAVVEMWESDDIAGVYYFDSIDAFPGDPHFRGNEAFFMPGAGAYYSKKQNIKALAEGVFTLTRDVVQVDTEEAFPLSSRPELVPCVPSGRCVRASFKNQTRHVVKRLFYDISAVQKLNPNGGLLVGYNHHVIYTLKTALPSLETVDVLIPLTISSNWSWDNPSDIQIGLVSDAPSGDFDYLHNKNARKFGRHSSNIEPLFDYSTVKHPNNSTTTSITANEIDNIEREINHLRADMRRIGEPLTPLGEAANQLPSDDSIQNGFSLSPKNCLKNVLIKNYLQNLNDYDVTIPGLKIDALAFVLQDFSQEKCTPERRR